MSLAEIFTSASKGKHVDEGLDDIFKSSAGPSSYARAFGATSAESSSSGLAHEENVSKDESPPVSSKKRKTTEVSKANDDKKKKKKKKNSTTIDLADHDLVPDGELRDENVFNLKMGKKKIAGKDVPGSADTDDIVDDANTISTSKKSKISDRKTKSSNSEFEEVSISPASPNIRHVEGDANTKSKQKSKNQKGHEEGNTDKLDPVETLSKSHKRTVGSDNSDSESDDQLESLPVHESVAANTRSGSSILTRKMYIPEDETSEQRNARTVFVGNLPLETAKSKSLLKQLKRHFTTAVPTKIESVRFRSVAFKTPTSRLDSDGLPAESESPSAKKQRQQKRAATWKDEHEDKTAEKRYLTSEEKRRIAFITGDFNDHADSVNAYIVFAHPLPDSLQPQNLPKKNIMNPYEAAKLAVKLCNGTKLLDRTIRVDLARHDDESMNGDARMTVFVGNLDFTTKEEDLRVFFEALMTVEKGHPESLNQEIEKEQKVAGEQKPTVPLKFPKWVTSVRVIRDRDAQLGKGFAYVQFTNRECVDEIIAMDPDTLKFAKRKLRVQRCKTVPGQHVENVKTKRAEPAKLPSLNKASSKKLDRGGQDTVVHNSSTSTKIPEIPNGNPFLGQKLVGLSKEMRKQVKANDKDRLARRLAKKKARAALAHANIGMKGSTSTLRGSDNKKERVRQRKPMKGKELNIGKKKSKGRVRSDKALAKMNVKKS